MLLHVRYNGSNKLAYCNVLAELGKYSLPDWVGMAYVLGEKRLRQLSLNKQH